MAWAIAVHSVSTVSRRQQYVEWTVRGWPGTLIHEHGVYLLVLYEVKVGKYFHSLSTAGQQFCIPDHSEINALSHTCSKHPMNICT